MLFFLNILIGVNGIAQTFMFENLDVEDGLLSSEVYDIVQDSAGILWIATDAGICKYDGYKFHSFSASKTIADNSVLKLFIGTDHTIWFSTYNGFVGYVSNNKLIVPSFNQNMRKLLEIEYIYHIYFAPDSTMFLTTNLGKLLSVKGNNIEVILNNPNPISLDFKLITKNDGYFYKFQYRYMHLLDNSDFLEFEFINDTLNLSLKHTHKSYHVDFCETAPHEYMLALNNTLYRIRNKKIVDVKRFDKTNRITDIFCDNNYLWVSFLKKGVHVYSYPNLNEPAYTLFSDKTITKILMDFEGCYWFSSFEDGIIMLPSISFATVNETTNKVIKTFDFYENKIYYAWYLNGLYSLNLFNLKNPDKYKLDNYDIYLDVIYEFQFHNGHFYIAPSMYSKYDLNFNPLGQPFPLANLTFTFIDDTLIYEGGQGYYQIHDNNYNLLFQSDAGFQESVFAICHDYQDNVWLGTLNGLYKHTDSIPINYGTVNPVFKSRISCINKYQKGIIIGTTKTGIIFKSNDTIITINESTGLVSNHIKCFHIDNNVLWAGTNKGLSKINVEKIEKKEYSIQNITYNDGLPANEIYKIKKRDSLLYLATGKGIVYFDPALIIGESNPPSTLLEQVIVGESDTLSKQFVELAPHTDNITFYYKGISFKNLDNLEYQHKLEGYDTEWIHTKNLSTRYPNLPYGDYCFRVKATTNRINFGKTASFQFTIKKHFTETVVFRLVMLILLIALIYLAIIAIIKYIRGKEIRKRQLLIAEHKALRLQMNPHFIFNSLGSIQRFILEKESLEASEYLTDFASLMRLILESSNRSLVSLSDEIKSLNLYMKLENLRFNNAIKYTIDIDQSIDKNLFKIPPLLIQPILENSIWHGIMNNGGKGRIALTFSKDRRNLLHVMVSDDGIGIKKAEQIKSNKNKHISTGISNIKERISLLNEIYKSDMKVEIADLGSQGSELKGTRVSIFIYYRNDKY